MIKIIDNVSTLDAAKAYAANGLSVFKLKANSKEPATTHGCKDATRDAPTLETWLKNSEGNLAIATGSKSNNLVVIDLDNHGDGKCFEVLQKWNNEHGALPPTLTVKTGSNGRHFYYFVKDDVIKNTTNAALNIDIRGEGGYVVAPPSTHPNGNKYEFIGNVDEIAIADENVLNFLHYVKSYKPAKAANVAPLEDMEIVEGERNDELFKYASSLQAQGIGDGEILKLVRKANQTKCNPPLTDDEVVRAVESVTSKYEKGDNYAYNATKSNLRRNYDKTQQRVNELKQMDAESRLKACKVQTIVNRCLDISHLDQIPPTISTGFKLLDEKLNGGLLSGSLTVIGSMSSFGKTSLCLAMAQNIARTQRPVLFVEIEQGSIEMSAKLVSSTMKDINTPVKVTYRELLNNKFRQQKELDMELRNSLDLALDEICNNYSEFLYIQEGINRPSVAEVEVMADTLAEKHGQSPVIFIDYLQLLAQQNERDDEKRTTDKNMTSLKQLANRLQTPVIAISSLNRACYNETIKMSSFKESGGIEYGADVLLGIQPFESYNIERNGKNGLSGAVKEAAAKIAKKYDDAEHEVETKIDVTILKQRNGMKDKIGTHFLFDKAFSKFYEFKYPSEILHLISNVKTEEDELEDYF